MEARASQENTLLKDVLRILWDYTWIEIGFYKISMLLAVGNLSFKVCLSAIRWTFI